MNYNNNHEKTPETSDRRHIIGMLVEDRPGVLARVSGLLARRGFNIDTITVGKTQKPGISKMVLTIYGDYYVLEQSTKQLNKLIDVIKVTELRPGDSIVYELGLVKVSISNEKTKNDLISFADIYKVKIADITAKSVIFQIIGKTEKIDSFIEIVKKYGIKEISRSGVTAMARGSKDMGA